MSLNTSKLLAQLDAAMLYDGCGEVSDLPERAAAEILALQEEVSCLRGHLDRIPKRNPISDDTLINIMRKCQEAAFAKQNQEWPQIFARAIERLHGIKPDCEL